MTGIGALNGDENGVLCLKNNKVIMIAVPCSIMSIDHLNEWSSVEDSLIKTDGAENDTNEGLDYAA